MNDSLLFQSVSMVSGTLTDAEYTKKKNSQMDAIIRVYIAEILFLTSSVKANTIVLTIYT